MNKLKRGMVREDGLVFWAYCKNSKNGERWVTQEKLEQYKQNETKRIKSIPLPSARKYKMGNVREDGMVFLSYRRNCKNQESWVTKEKLAEYKQAQIQCIKNARKKDPQKARSSDRRKALWRYFKITPEQYEQMLKSQNGVCKTCGEKCLSGRNLAVDHCHVSGKIRGLLCSKCNRAIGLLNDSPELIKRVADYVERFQTINH